MNSGAAAEAQNLLSPKELEETIIYLVGFWLEALLYGLYLCIFIATIVVFVREDVKKPLAAKVFLVGNSLMFVLITMHNVLNGYRLVVGFVNQISAKAPLAFLSNIGLWYTFALPILISIIIWIGDALVIYRCFLIWQHSWRIIAIPVLLYFLTFAVQVANFWLAGQQGDVRRLLVGRWPILNWPFPLYLSQNIITTGLIIFKIWWRHRSSRVAGLAPPLYAPSLISIMRVIVESASLYTALMLIMVILRAIDHPARLLIHCILVPIIGITFTLMAFRMHTLSEDARNAPRAASLMPPWLVAEREDAPSLDDYQLRTYGPSSLAASTSVDGLPTSADTKPLQTLDDPATTKTLQKLEDGGIKLG